MEKVFKVADIRDLEQKVALGEMSYSRMVEVLNEKTEEYYNKVKKLNEPAVSKSEDIERDTSCKHSDWIDLYYSSGDIYGRYCMDCGEFFE